MKKRPALKYLIFSLAALILIIIFRPAPPIDEAEALIETGRVERIYEVGNVDLAFQLENGETFVIREGVEQDLRADSLSELYLNKELTFKYPEYWSPINRDSTKKHASQVQWGEEIIYTEFKKKRKP